MLNAASTNINLPVNKIPPSYLRIINSDTTGMANKELQSQMSELGYADARFAHVLAASLYMGEIMWNNHSSPSNLSPFNIFELDPFSTAQTARCLHLHLLSKNTKGKLMDELKASSEAAPCLLQPCYFAKWDIFADTSDYQYVMGFPVCILNNILWLFPISCHLLMLE